MTSSEPSVRRAQAESYLLASSDGWNHARIFLLEGQRPHRPILGYVSFVSSYGLFGHCFSHIHVPIKSFFHECDRDYLLNKLMDGQAQIFDYDASLAHIHTLITTSVSPDRRADLLATLDSIDDPGLTQKAFALPGLVIASGPPAPP